MPRAWTIGVSRILQDWLDELEVPIAVLVPDEVVESIRSTVEAVSLQLGRHGGDGTVEAAENPAVRESPFGWGNGAREPSTYIKLNRAAFQILLAKFRYPSIRSSASLRSRPGEAIEARVNRSASVPNSSITWSGSITLPFDLLIF